MKTNNFNLSADIVIVGAGSAGCVLAARLSEDPRVQVLLLEAGGRDSNPWIHVPAGYYRTVNDPRLDWRFTTEPEAGTADRRLPWPRGKVLGGTSSINGMLYLRGNPRDYDTWHAAGNTGWGWDEVLPYFRRAEDQVRGPSAYHGVGGPLTVSDIAPNELSDAFVEAARQAGYPFKDDFNGLTNEGAGYYQMVTRGGLRCSTAKAYLAPARHRPNLRVVSHAHATRVLFDGVRAVGVEFRRGGRVQRAQARGEVILSAGAVQSPQLLQLSGIGPGELLARYQIPALVNAPGVGRHLQDHLQVRVTYRCTRPITLNDDFRSPWRKLKIGLEYLLRRQGTLAIGVYRAGAFVRSCPQVEWPDLQIHFGLISFDRLGRPPHRFPGFTFSVCNLRPTSTGTIEIGSGDPFEAPLIRPNYMETEHDRRLMIRAVRLARELAVQPAMKPYIVAENAPGAECRDDDELLAWIAGNASSIFHPTSTCRMGNDTNAVVDERLRVHGVLGLRVADASIMPNIVSGNTNAPSIMIGEKAADLILADARRT